MSTEAPPIRAIDQLRRLWEHVTWADALVHAALGRATSIPPDALREYAHLLGAEETWLSRLEGRASRSAIWPTLAYAETTTLATSVHEGYARLLATLDDAALARDVAYRNSAGQPFETTLGDILLHVALHGQYHRGRVNLLLRQGGQEPAPVDYVSWVRGVPAARTDLGAPQGAR